MGSNGAMKASLLVTLLVVAVAVGCKQERYPVRQVTAIPVEQLVENAPQFAHQIVTVSGCYVRGFERSTLQPCASQKRDEIIWVESAEYLYESAKISTQSSAPVPKALRFPPKAEFVFQYDAAKCRAAWEKLHSDSSRLEVTLVGQFDSIVGRKVNTNPNDLMQGFGHLGAFDHRLILIETLKSKPL